MADLIGLVKPLLHIMLAAILLGTLGYLCAISLTIFAGELIVYGIGGADARLFGGLSVHTVMTVMVVAAVLRGVLHYAEQYCNHFIAFKLLAIIRHKVFAALRRLCPAKLEGRDKGNLISIITTDIELLEVFYAHTISPIAIAILTSLTMILFIGSYHVLAGVLAAVSYIVVGVLIPVWNGRRGGDDGMTFRNEFGELNSYVLDCLYGLDETIQYGCGDDKKRQMSERSRNLADIQKKLSHREGAQRSVTNAFILLASFAMLALTTWLHESGGLGYDGVIICTIAMMGSFGPVVALASLSNNLNQTLASGERVLSLLEEEPVCAEIVSAGGSPSPDKQSSGEVAGVELSHVTFSYNKEESGEGGETRGNILDDFSAIFEPGRITGIHGESGCGKSTMLKLIMRFWSSDRGTVSVGRRDVEKIPTAELRDVESYVTQETHLFHTTIAKNIAIGKPGASMDEIVLAAKKASIHDFIMSLPDGYDTEVGELGDTLSGGEKQRIGIARAFLHDSELILLDEPTSNLDSLNEGIILKSLRESAGEKTVIIVSHRSSTMSVADVVVDV